MSNFTRELGKMNLWNTKNLPIPPIDTYKAVDANIDLKHLNKVFQDGNIFFTNEHHMRAEYAVLSRIIYRTKQKFKSAKDFKALIKIHRALDNYLKTNFSYDLQSFIALIPYRYKNETYLPNKNLLDYILVRLQGLVKLLERIVESCKITAYLFERRLHTGHFWKIGLIIFSIVSRIYVLAKYSAKFICEFYAKAFPFSQQLKNSGCNWLPKNYILPTDLKKWMNVDWLDIDDELQIIEPSELSRIAQYFDLIDDDDIQFCDEYVMVDDDEEFNFSDGFKNGGNSNNKQNMNFVRGFYTDEDIGEVIEINDKNVLLNKNRPIQNEDVGEVITINESLLINENDSLRDTCDNSEAKENSVDFGEVIEQNSLGNRLRDLKEYETNKSETNEIISLLDDSIRSDIQNIKYSSPLMIPTKGRDIIQLDEDVEIIDTPTEYKLHKKKEKVIKNKNKLTYINNKIKTFKKDMAVSNNSVTSKTLSESDGENIIIVSDSSFLHEDVIDKSSKKKKVKNKVRKKVESSVTLNSFKSDIFTNTTDVINLCSNESNKKKKNKNFKTDEINLTSLTPVHSEFQCSSGVKRKWGIFSETPSKKIKSEPTYATECSQFCIDKEKTVEETDTREIPQNATKTNQDKGVCHRRKDKFKNKTMKQLDNTQRSSDLQHKKVRRRKKKYRYYLTTIPG